MGIQVTAVKKAVPAWGSRVFRLGCALTFVFLAAAQVGADTHWSLLPRTTPAAPKFSDAAARHWVRNSVDAFVLQALRAKGLEPAPAASRATLIRRLYFDLTGLPPTPAAIADFVNDESSDAYERLVERLLASPHYGERWAQHWLDVVRFAESDGFEYDRYRPGMWRYRDYVIKCFNEDRPFDRFLIEQLAGDEIDVRNEELQVAAGFLRLGPVRRNAGNQDVAFSRNEVLTEMTDAVGMVFLGLTVGCARCHDHRFDDFTQVDYYRLQAFMAATHEHDHVLADEKTQAQWTARTKKLNDQIKLLKEQMKKASPETRATLEAKLRAAEMNLPAPLPTLSTVRDLEPQRTPIHVLRRGLPENKGKRVEPGFPAALASSGKSAPPGDAKTTPRLALARWLADPQHPLTTRVFVNRVWQYHFGRGLVETSNDFGVNGARPSHPELLDYLANEFVAQGMRLKPLHRLIVLSSSYRQGVATKESAAKAKTLDPANRLLWQFPRQRLSAEQIRDAMLAAAGRLNLKAEGKSVVVPVEQDLVKLLYDPRQWQVTPDEREHDRRSIYLLAKRNLRLPFGQVFDQPDLQTSCPRREASTHALQALELLNGQLANQLAASFATRLQKDAGPDPTRQVTLAFLLTTGRPPTPAERDRAVRFLESHPLREFALAMFNLNAFLYVE